MKYTFQAHSFGRQKTEAISMNKSVHTCCVYFICSGLGKDKGDSSAKGKFRVCKFLENRHSIIFKFICSVSVQCLVTLPVSGCINIHF